MTKLVGSYLKNEDTLALFFSKGVSKSKQMSENVFFQVGLDKGDFKGLILTHFSKQNLSNLVAFLKKEAIPTPFVEYLENFEFSLDV